MITGLLSAILFLPAPQHVLAQRVSGTVVHDATGAPVAGAIVSALLSEGRDTTAAVLAQADGRFNLSVAARGEFTLLVRSIGLQPVRIPLRPGRDTVVQVRMSRITHTLQPVSVVGLTECRRSQTGTANVVDIWLEITSALENTRIARDSIKRRFHYVVYETLKDLRTGRVSVLRNDSSSWVATRPFKVTPARELASDGYVVVEQPTARTRLQGVTWNYRAPDEMVLLDRSFQNSHCFWASHGSGDNDGMIGVHFLPVTGIGITDIRGVFWLDEQSYELRRLDYVYTQIDGRRSSVPESNVVIPEIKPHVSNPEPGGVIEFMRLADGSFIIPAWRIFVNDTWTPVALNAGLRTPTKGKETGGIVISMTGG